MIWLAIGLGILLLLLVAYGFQQYMGSKAFEGLGELAKWVDKIQKATDKPGYQDLRARARALGPKSPLRDWMTLRRDDRDGILDLRIRYSVMDLPRLTKQLNDLLASSAWTDRLLALDAIEFAREISPETAALAASTVREFALAFPAAAADVERGLLAAARACEALHQRGLPHESASRELLAASSGFVERQGLHAVARALQPCVEESTSSPTGSPSE